MKPRLFILLLHGIVICRISRGAEGAVASLCSTAHRMRLVCYNPLSLSSEGRTEEVSEAFSNADVIFCQGTQIKEKATPGKGKGKGKYGNRDYRSFTITREEYLTLHKGVLRSLQRTRLFEGTTYLSFEMAADHSIIKAMDEAGKKYGAECRRLGKGHGLGHPDLYKAQALFQELVKVSIESVELKSLLEKLLKMFDSELDVQGLSTVFMTCRTEKLYDSTRVGASGSTSIC